MLAAAAWAVQAGRLASGSRSGASSPQWLSQLLLGFGFDDAGPGPGHTHGAATTCLWQPGPCAKRAGGLCARLLSILQRSASPSAWPLVQRALWQQLCMMPLHAACAWLMGGRLRLWLLLHAAWCVALPGALSRYQSCCSGSGAADCAPMPHAADAASAYGRADIPGGHALLMASSPRHATAHPDSHAGVHLSCAAGPLRAAAPHCGLQHSAAPAAHPLGAWSPLLWGALIPGLVGAAPFLLHAAWRWLQGMLLLCAASLLARACWRTGTSQHSAVHKQD